MNLLPCHAPSGSVFSRAFPSLIWGLLALPFTVYTASPLQVNSRPALQQALRDARPGSVIQIAPGTYGGGLSASDLKGTPDQPIVIEAADSAQPPLFTAAQGGNTALHLSACSHVTLRHLRLTGFPANGLNIDDGGARNPPAEGIRLEHVAIENTGPRGNHDALKLSGLRDFTVTHCTFTGWGGSGIDMVGCHKGRIDQCRFEGRPGFSQSNGVQMKGGSSHIQVTRSTFLNAGQRGINLGGSTGLPFFRPLDAAWEASDIEVAGNVFIGGLTPLAWVGIDGGLVHHNTIYLPEKWVGRILQENTAPRFGSCKNGHFTSNLIVYDRRVQVFFNVGPGTQPETFHLDGNLWHCQDDPKRRPRGLPVRETNSIEVGDLQVNFDPDTSKVTIRSHDARTQRVGAGGYDHPDP